MPNKHLAGVWAAFSMLILTSTAQATIVTVAGALPSGITAFDSYVVGAGSVVLTDTWDDFFDVPALRPGYDMSYALEGRTFSTFPDMGIFGDISGFVVNLSPLTNGPDLLNTKIGGMVFDFHDPVNAFGIEVENWGICCAPSGLYIAFGDGDPIELALFDGDNDTAWTGGPREVFVGAIDDSAGFSKVTFWGNGVGEGFNIGGTVRYALVKPPDVSPVPLPAGFWLFGAAVGGVYRLARNKGNGQEPAAP